MIVRLIKESDIPAVIHLGGEIHDESVMRMLSYSPDKIALFSRQIIANPEEMLGVVAYSDNILVGMLAAYIFAPIYSEELMSWDEVFYVKKNYRGSSAFIRMIKMYVEWARKARAKMIYLRTSSGIAAETTEGYMVRMGFLKMGGNYLLGGI